MRAEGSFTESRDHPPTGTLLRGRYEVGEPLGEGGFFTVSQGRDVTTGRPVAVKALKREFRTDPEFVARMRAEAEESLRLTHPGIAQVYEIWEEGGTLYLATEWVRGINLKERMRRPILPMPSGCRPIFSIRRSPVRGKRR